jgi:hypothetical protein
LKQISRFQFFLEVPSASFLSTQGIQIGGRLRRQPPGLRVSVASLLGSSVVEIHQGIVDRSSAWIADPIGIIQRGV